MRMGGVSWLTRRPLSPVTHTHALFADQSHSIPDNLVALLPHSRAWNCSGPERMVRRTRDRQYGWLTEGSSPALQVKVLPLHLSRSAAMTTQLPRSPTLRIDPK